MKLAVDAHITPREAAELTLPLILNALTGGKPPRVHREFANLDEARAYLHGSNGRS